METLVAWKRQPPSETVHWRERQSSVAIKNYVDSLKDRSVQRALKNINRDQSFRKVVLYKSDNTSRLICQTDDFVLVSDCSTYQKRPCTYWLIKQEERHMLQGDLEYLRKLYEGKPVERGKYADHLQ